MAGWAKSKKVFSPKELVVTPRSRTKGMEWFNLEGEKMLGGKGI